MEVNEITGRVIGAAIRVHRAFGPVLLESAYEERLALELRHEGLRCCTQVPVRVVVAGARSGRRYKLDLLVEGNVVVELKSVAILLPVHKAQLRTYLKLTGCPVGLLINFNTAYLGKGSIIRVVNNYTGPRPSESS